MARDLGIGGCQDGWVLGWVWCGYWKRIDIVLFELGLVYFALVYFLLQFLFCLFLFRYALFRKLVPPI